MTELEQVCRIKRLADLLATVNNYQAEAELLGLASLASSLDAHKADVLTAIRNVVGNWIYAIESNQE